MREKLKEIHGVRSTFKAIFVRHGERTSYGYVKKTLLFQDVRDSHDRVMTDHLWFTAGKWSDSLNLEPGDAVQFEARVTQYKKGYRGRRDDDFDDRPPPSIDYRLSHPTKIRKLKPITVPLFDGPVPPSPTEQESLFT